MTPLLAQMRRGERAFERLYRRHVADVYRYALVLLRDPDDAEGVTQSTFLSAYRAFTRGERPRNARAWLLALAHAACRQRARPDDEAEHDEPVAAEAGPASPSEIRRALAYLPFNERAALVMRELESRSYAEIAEVLALSPAGVETLVFEARRALREQLEGALSCHEAERAISRQIDGRLARAERKPLRRHLRECSDCSGFARSQRAQRSAWKVLATIPLPASLKSFFGPGGVMATTLGDGAGSAALGVVGKALALAAIGLGGLGALHQSLGYGTRGSTLPLPVMEQAAPSVGPAMRAVPPTVSPVQARALPRATSRPVPRAATPTAARSTQAQAKRVAKPTAAATAPAPSAAIAVRPRALPKPLGGIQTAAVHPRAAPSRPEPTARVLAPVPAPSLQPPGLPQFPQQAPPLPVPLPVLPKLP
jgi:RNA polymerase sigma factor (sigma-70 family)